MCRRRIRPGRAPEGEDGAVDDRSSAQELREGESEVVRQAVRSHQTDFPADAGVLDEQEDVENAVEKG